MRSFIGIVVIAVLGLPAGAEAQTRVSLHYGIGQYDLNGVYEAPVAAVRVTRDVHSLFAIEAGATHVKLEDDLAGEATLYQPELQAQVKLPLGVFAPYLGAGAGMSFGAEESGAQENEVTLNAGAGFRIEFGNGLGLVADGRLRNIGKLWTATGADATLGISYRF